MTVDHIVKATRLPRSWLDRLERLGKDPPLARRGVPAKRRDCKISAIRTSAPGRSAFSSILTVHTATPSHTGHRQLSPLITITKPPSSFVALLNAKSARNKFRTPNPCIALIPCSNQSQSRPSTSLKVSRSHFSTQDHMSDAVAGLPQISSAECANYRRICVRLNGKLLYNVPEWNCASHELPAL